MGREWLTYRAHCDQVEIIHEHRDGREERLGWRALPVDGYAKTSNTVYQFHGYMIHGHDCQLTGKDKIERQVGAISGELMEDLAARK